MGRDATTGLPDEPLYAEALGPRRTDWYLRRFRRFASGGTPLSWNASAGLFTLGWLWRRKLDRWAWLYLPVSLPVLATVFVAALAGSDACLRAAEDGGRSSVLGWTLLALAVAGFVVPWLFANRLYYAHLGKRIARLRAAGDDAQARERFRRDSGTSVSGWVAGVVAVLWFLFVGAAIPGGHGSYTTRAQISEALLLASGQRTAIAEYYETHRKLPATPEDVGGVPRAVEGRRADVALEPDGTLRVTLRIRGLEGRTLLLRPVPQGERLEWACSSPDLHRACLPAVCRK